MPYFVSYTITVLATPHLVGPITSVCVVGNNDVESAISTHVLVAAGAPVLPLTQVMAGALCPLSFLVEALALLCV